jgi:hypothetical protein
VLGGSGAVCGSNLRGLERGLERAVCLGQGPGMTTRVLGPVPNAIRSLPTGSRGGSPGGQQRKRARGGSGPWADVF